MLKVASISALSRTKLSGKKEKQSRKNDRITLNRNLNLVFVDTCAVKRRKRKQRKRACHLLFMLIVCSSHVKIQ